MKLYGSFCRNPMSLFRIAPYITKFISKHLTLFYQYFGHRSLFWV